MTELNLPVLLVNGTNEVTGEETSAVAAATAVVVNVLNNRSSDTNLMDSCVDDEDDDEDASVNACDSSDEYAMYVDKTGRQQQHPPMDVPLPQSANANTGRMIYSHVTPVPPSTAAVTPENTARTPKTDHHSNPTSSPSTMTRRNVSVSPPGMDGLEFDMNQPWERSLLRQLEQPNESNNAHPSVRYELKKTDPIALLTTTTTKPMMLLGHTESRDYAMEYDVDDNVSLETSSSCPPGRKMQFIHRSPFAPPQPRVVYHIPSSNDDDHNNYQTASYYYHHSPPPPPSAAVATDMPPHAFDHPLPIMIGPTNHHHPTAASSLTNGSYTTDDGRDDELVMMMGDQAVLYNKIPAHLPQSVTTHTMQPPQPYQYLEMEASTASYGEMDYNSKNEQQHQQHYLNPPNMDHIQQDPGCFCLGYNMLDYIISAAPPTPAKQRASLGKKQRLNGVLRPVRLPRVTESATMIDHIGRPMDQMDMLSEVIDATTTVELSSSVAPIKKMRSVEPEGMYLPTTTTHQNNNPADDRYYNSSSPSMEEYNETRRQGVDL